MYTFQRSWLTSTSVTVRERRLDGRLPTSGVPFAGQGELEKRQELHNICQPFDISTLGRAISTDLYVPCIIVLVRYEQVARRRQKGCMDALWTTSFACDLPAPPDDMPTIGITPQPTPMRAEKGTDPPSAHVRLHGAQTLSANSSRTTSSRTQLGSHIKVLCASP